MTYSKGVNTYLTFIQGNVFENPDCQKDCTQTETVRQYFRNPDGTFNAYGGARGNFLTHSVAEWERSYEMDVLFRQLKVLENQSILEVGCGPLRSGESKASASLKKWNITLSDCRQEEPVSKGRKYFHIDLNEIETFPEEVRKACVVFGWNVFNCEVPKYLNLWAENLYKVLPKGGRVIAINDLYPYTNYVPHQLVSKYPEHQFIFFGQGKTHHEFYRIPNSLVASFSKFLESKEQYDLVEVVGKLAKMTPIQKINFIFFKLMKGSQFYCWNLWKRCIRDASELVENLEAWKETLTDREKESVAKSTIFEENLQDIETAMLAAGFKVTIRREIRTPNTRFRSDYNSAAVIGEKPCL